MLALALLLALGSALNTAGVRLAHAAMVSELTIGSSGGGRPIIAVRIGSGPRKLVVVGDTHGGPEANTYTLTNQLIEHFRANPTAVPNTVSLYLIPTLNPDGLALGTRFNANGVDLNRNMNTGLDSCPENDWRVQVQGALGIESNTGGQYAESEVESRLIRDFLLDANGAIFLHSNAGLVFPAFCDHQPSIAMSEVYARGAGYTYSRYWEAYTITGGMHDWAGSLGIAAITPELLTGDQSEFEQNLGGLTAVLALADELLPAPADHEEAGINMPALIWRYWKAHGGQDRFGPPLAPATQEGAATRQTFERAVLELGPDSASGTLAVHPVDLGRSMGRTFPPVPPTGAGRFFAETGHSLEGSFLDYWERADGFKLFGYPLSEELEIISADGQRRMAQYFERAVLAYYPEDNSIRPEPLGWAVLLRERLLAPTLSYQIR